MSSCWRTGSSPTWGPAWRRGTWASAGTRARHCCAITWPGNIRELQNAVERALIVSDGGLLTAAQLGIGQAIPHGEIAPRTQPIPAADAAPARPLAEIEHQAVQDALRESKGNKSKAAVLLGLTRSQLYTRLKRHGLED